MPCPSILLVDDDRELTQMLKEYLLAESFAVEVAKSGTEALDKLLGGGFDLAILDVMLPAMNGFELLRRLPRPFTLPVIMLTARGEEVDRILGLELGADDYLAKPFNPRELLARIRAVLRRAGGGGQPVRSLEIGPLRINGLTFEASLHDRPLHLTGTEFRVLENFMLAPGQIHARDVLTEKVLGRKLSGYDRSIDTHVSNLRRKLAAAGRDDGIDIRAIRLLGYVLIVPETTR